MKTPIIKTPIIQPSTLDTRLRKPSLGHSSASALINYLTNHLQVTPKAIYNQTGLCLTPLTNHHEDNRIPLNQYNQLWNMALQISKDPALGLKLGTAKDLSQMGIVGHVVYNSENLLTGLQHYIRLFNIINDALAVTFERSDDLGTLTFIHKFPEYYCIPDMERSLVLALYRTRAWLDKNLPLESVHFCHQAPSYQAYYRKVFDCPVLFNQTECKLVFASKYLALQSPKSNPYIRQASLNYANELIEKLNLQSFSERVKNYIYRELEHCEPSIERISSLLNVSKQTLSRRLKMEGAFFQKLVESVRFDKARQLLTQSALSSSEIAFALGFSELSAFSRAFKRWSGMSPKDFRQNIMNA